jgi:hypothetical protein
MPVALIVQSRPGQATPVPILTPEPEWTGVLYDPSIYGETAFTGDTASIAKFALPGATIANSNKKPIVP